MTKKVPKNWPQEVIYLNKKLSKSKKAEVLLSQIHLQTQLDGIVKTDLQEVKLIIKPIMNDTHPACGQLGLFAGQKIKPRSLIIDYVGFVHTDSESELDSDYDIVWISVSDMRSLGIDAESLHECTICIDAKRCGNEARCINDYRKVANKPNVEFKLYYNTNFRELRLGVFSIDTVIEKGTELLVTYGKGFWKART
jgi:hypothetical protein